MKIEYPAPGTHDDVAITLTFLEAIGLYKLVLSEDDPRGRWPSDDEDIQPVSAALQVQLAGIVGP
jgi:hypothetical protein